MERIELSRDKYTLVNGNKFKLLFKNEKFEIVEVKTKRRDGSGKWNSFYYADFGYTTYQDMDRYLYTVDFDSKSDLKDFIKRIGIEDDFSKSYMKAA